jgi:hypothetical protein
MKKILIIATIILTASTAVFAGDEDKVSPRAVSSFNADFSSAQEVDWQVSDKYYRAAFTMNEQRIFAYYNLEGDLMSIARYISSLQLPVTLFNDLKKEYSQYWISDLFEVSNSEGLHYYVTLETADTKLMMRSGNGGNWNEYKKTKKA